MSTRRSTRGTSRAASSRGTSPALSNTDIPPTPRRTSRRSGSATPLTAVASRTSTAYGTNSVAPPATGPAVTGSINEFLEEQIQPVKTSSKAGSRVSRASRAKTPARTTAEAQALQEDRDRSFSAEEGIFDTARIESSVMSEDQNDLSGIPELDEPESDDAKDITPPPTHMNEIDAAAEKQRIREIHDATLSRSRLFEARMKNGQAYLNVWDGMKDALSKGAKFFSKYLFPIALATAALLIIALCIRTDWNTVEWSRGLTRPTEFFKPSDVQALNRRLSELEYKVARMSSSPSSIDPKALKAIQDLLPDYLVVKTDKFGNTVIPDAFWHALQDKIRSDETLLRDQAGSIGKPISSGKPQDLEKLAKRLWEKYLRQNLAEASKISESEFGQLFPVYLKQNKIIPKSEVLNLIRVNWEENRSEIKSEMSDLSKKLHRATQQINKLQHEYKDESTAIANEVLKRFVSSGQINALASANLKSNVNYGLTRVNHFSKGTGAAIDVHLTSPQFIFPSYDVWFPQRFISWAFSNPIPIPNSPYTALINWEEHGDCWCSPSRGTDGFGPSLAVIMGSSILPDQVVVEHISSSASLEPGAAPKDMELLALYPDPNVYKVVKKLSDSIFPDQAQEPVGPIGYVRIATWTYDLETSQNVQAFPVQLDIKALGGHTNKVIVRSKNNWGGETVDYTCLYRIRLHGDVVATPGLY
ncbi:spindle pole body-associated protein sad1 [Diplocarpon rosae]|nr:spindle pole body-associated protein sad1 [Diplocarpon rosae]